MAEVTAGRLGEVIGAGVVGDPEVQVSAVTHDSARVLGGSLFCCLRGERFDGHRFADDALAAGAAALLVDTEFPVDSVGPETTLLVVNDTRAAIGPLAAEFWGHPSHDIAVVGVTGTNGKTTTVTLVVQLMAHLGVRCGVIGTLTGARTTPESTDLQSQLRAFADGGYEAVAIEVSSHALAMRRIDGTRFEVAVFTNLGVDHLDFHETQERYFQAKARLFDPGLSRRGVTNLDDVHGRLLRDAAAIPMTTYSVDSLESLATGRSGSRFVWRGHEVQLPLAGRFNVANALAAAEAVVALGHDAATVATALSSVEAPPGRFELVRAGQPFAVVVDYAHTPDALENLLLAAGELVDGGALRVVFGCGGDRDVGKRPAMGSVASKLADSVVITSDNPRSEDPAAIIAAVKSGCDPRARASSIVTEVDRRRAIDRALVEAVEGDVVVLAGKGHETTQTCGDAVIPFDDRAVAGGEVLETLGWVLPR